MTARFRLADVGNTRLSTSTVSPTGFPENTVRIAIPVADLSAIAPASPHDALHLVTVNPAFSTSVRPRLEAVGWSRIVVWGQDVEIPVRHGYPSGTRPGADRLAAAAAAYRRARRGCVVIDAGTAVTVDVVDADGIFLGGAIAPGRRALAAGLRGAAPGLPLVDVPTSPASFPGASTNACLEAGLSAGFGGLLRTLAESARAAAGPAAPVFVTGGDADAVLRYVPDVGMEHVDALVLEGVAVFAGLLH